MLKSSILAFAASAFAASPAFADLRIVTDIPPVQSLVQQVAGDAADVELLLSGVISPHDFALRPSQAQLLSDADAIIWVGAGLTPQLGDAMATLGGDAKVIALAELPGTIHRSRREDAVFLDNMHDDAHGHDDDHDDAHGHDEDHGDEDDHAHDHSADDPHLWLDPANAELWLTALAENLATLDPANAEIFAANAAKAAANLRTMSEDIAADLASVSPSYVVAHDALVHFEQRFDVPAVGALSGSDAASPGPRRVAALTQALEDRAVRCILVDVSEPSALAGSLGTDSTTVLEIDPLGQRLSAGQDLYESVIRDLAETIAECDVE